MASTKKRSTRRRTGLRARPTKADDTLDELAEFDTHHGLCVRCEHRAQFLETGHRPRCECGDVLGNVRVLIGALHQIAEPGPGRGKEMPCDIAKQALDRFESEPPQAGGSCNCYMYRPVRPLVLAPNAGDKRPILGPAMIAARMRRVGIADCVPQVKVVNDCVIPWQKPDGAVSKEKYG